MVVPGDIRGGIDATEAVPMVSVTATASERAESSDAMVIAASIVDADQFGVLYDRYAAALYRYAQRRVGPELAEDVVADTFVAAFRHRSRYDLSRPDARPWLFGILTRELAHNRRGEVRRYRALARAAPDAVTDTPAERVVDAVAAGALRGRLTTALAALSARDRDVLLLIAWGDLTYEEVADALGIPVGTVRSRLHRARSHVRAALGGTDLTDVEEP
jgi:RNA polymerase sigma factor (sigma-70 family)